MVFYLLKDLSPSTHEDKNRADTFANNVHLEKRFRTFIEGIWDLDHLMFETAVQHLTHPSIIQTFPDEILLALLRKGDRGDGENAGPKRANDPLPLAYFDCARPPLQDARTRREFAKYISARNVTEAWFWIKSRPEHERRELLEILIDTTLFTEVSNHLDHTARNKYPQSDRAMELVALPFEEEEDKWLETYLTEGKGRLHAGAQDTVLMRKMATGKLADVGKEGGYRGRRHYGLSWEVLREGVKKGLGPRVREGEFVV